MDQEHEDMPDTSCAEFWPSPIAWARDHEAEAPADSIDLFVTPLGFEAAAELTHSGAVWGSR